MARPGRPALPAGVPRLSSPYTRSEGKDGWVGEQSTRTQRANTSAVERAPEHQRGTEHDDTPRTRARRGAAMHALTPGGQREEVEELQLDDEGRVQVLRDHVAAERERGDAPEGSTREERVVSSAARGMVRVGFGAKTQAHGKERGRMDSRLTRGRGRALGWTWCAMF